MKPLNLDQLVKELARRAKIGNGQDYRHARQRMGVRHQDLDAKLGRRRANVPDA